MSGSKAKRLRKLVYGDLSLKNRKYFRDGERVISDDKRRFYQKAKKKYKEKVLTPKRKRKFCPTCYTHFKTRWKHQVFCRECSIPSIPAEEDIKIWIPFFNLFFARKPFRR